MAFDIVIRNGTVIDGSGLAEYRADIGISNGRIAHIGKITEQGRRTIDAEGHYVTPGFIDGHAHYDAQVFWDQAGTSSCWHGVTTLIMGNCGFTLAPCRTEERDLVLDNLERAEDVPRNAMLQGIDWTWESYPDYLKAVDSLPKAVNYGSYIGHSAVRATVMGKRAQEELATDGDIAEMKQIVREAMLAGAMGFTTSQSEHKTPDGRPVASRVAGWEEICELVGVLGDLGTGVFELALPKTTDEQNETIDTVLPPQWERIKQLSVATNIPVMFGVHPPAHLGFARLRLLEETNAAGGRGYGQTASMAIHRLRSFELSMPFDSLPEWKEFRALPLEEQKRQIRDPQVRERLIRAGSPTDYDHSKFAGPEARPSTTGYSEVEVYSNTHAPNPTVADLALERGVDPIEVFIDLAIQSDFKQFYLQGSHRAKSIADDETILGMLKHPYSLMTFTDTGAHASQIVGGCMQSHFLARFVRGTGDFTWPEAIRLLTLAPALAWKIPDRGLVREGMIADLNVFDPETVAPVLPEIVHDLPGGALRIIQRAQGYKATLVGGEVTLENGESTGATSGELIRGRLAYTAH